MRVTVVIAVLTAAGGCGGHSATPLAAAPEPAVSPPAEGHLPGIVLALAGAPEGVIADRAGTVAVNVRHPDALVLFDVADPARRRFVPLAGSARHLALAGPDGPLLVPTETDDQLVEVALPAGQVLSSTPVGRQPHDAAAAAGGAVFVGDELANTIHVVRGGTTWRVVAAPLQPGGVAASPDGAVVVAVGVRGRRLSAYRADGSRIGTADCGAGPTHVVAGADGVFWVADTNGGAVLAFRVGAGGPRQVARVLVGSKPYGLAYDTGRSTLWVTLTGTNQLVGLRLRGTAVTARVVFATVRQPNAVAVADAAGEVVVVGSSEQGAVQLLRP